MLDEILKNLKDKGVSAELIPLIEAEIINYALMAVVDSQIREEASKRANELYEE